MPVRPDTTLAEKALEKQVVLDRINRRDVQHVAHDAVGRRAAALDQDAVLAAPPAKTMTNGLYDLGLKKNKTWTGCQKKIQISPLFFRQKDKRRKKTRRLFCRLADWQALTKCHRKAHKTTR
jgi:hypothetical protein